MSKTSFLIFISLFTLNFFIVTAQNDQYGFRGPQRNGIYPDKGLLQNWPEDGPELAWSVKGIGDGLSSPVVANDIVYVTGINKSQTKEILSAYTLQGVLLFQVAYDDAWDRTYPEARTTPTIEGFDLFVISARGKVICINAITGDIKWEVNGSEKFKAKPGIWGIAESPLVFDNKVIYTPAGNTTTMVALNKKNGSVIWQSPTLNEESSYLSPIIYTHNGKKQIAMICSYWVFGINPENGKIEWKYEVLPENKRFEKNGGKKSTIFTNSPVYYKGRLFITNGYDQGAFQLRLSKDASSVSLVWRNDKLDTQKGGVVIVDEKIYGSNWINHSSGNWYCADWETGIIEYEQAWPDRGRGSIISADGMLYCFEEKTGFMGLVRPTPLKFDLISEFRTHKGSSFYWAHPMINSGKLFVRHGDCLLVYKLRE